MAQKATEEGALDGERVVPVTIVDPLSQAQRRANRTYMQRWRSDLTHREAERARRLARYHARKVQQKGERLTRGKKGNGELDASDSAFDGMAGEADPKTDQRPLCRICRKRRAVREIARLRISKKSRSGFVEVRMPYCGEC